MEGENELLKAEDVGIIFSEASKKDRMLVDSKALSVVEEEVAPAESRKITREELRASQLADDVISPVFNKVLASESMLFDTEKHRGTMLLSRQRNKLFVENGVLLRHTARG